MRVPAMVATVLLVMAAFMAAPRRSNAAEYRVPLMATPPSMDGRTDPREWQGRAAQFEGFAWNGQLERRRAVAYVGATASHLYLAIVTQLPAVGELTTAVQSDSVKLVYDDSAEVWLDPTPGQERGRTYQMLANAAGRRAYQMHARGGEPEDPTWRGRWQVISRAVGGWWHLEVAIPVGELVPGRTADQGAWGINLCRNWKQPWSFSSLGGGAYAPGDRFVFARGAVPAVSVGEKGDPFGGSPSPVVTVTNPGPERVKASVALLVKRDRMPDLRRDETVDLGPGEGHQVAAQVGDTTSRSFTQAVRVVDASGTVVYDRETKWQAGEPGWKWVASKRVVPPIDFQFAYYPYRNRMRILADVSGLPPGAQANAVVATVRRKGGPAVKAVRFDRFVNGRQEQSFALPPLQGSYEIAVRAEGRGVPGGEVVKLFERTRYPWERNRLGRSEKVYPPFTPIVVRGRTLSTVLRQHTLNATGLWDQVAAAGKPLLAGPIRLIGYQPGRRAGDVLKAAAFRVVSARPNQVRTASSLRLGACSADAACTWDVDGMMRYDLTLKPGRVDRLTLEIPLREDAARLLHAMGDGIRNTLYEPVPPAAGRSGPVWTADRVQASDLPRGFCSYIFVGTPSRGLCWFAENDRGWSRDPSKPNLDLTREGDRVVLRVYLVNKPLLLRRPQTITFGLQAAPVKPRLGPWRHQWMRGDYTLLGTDINWLALGDCGSVYPAGKDMALWQAIRKGNRERVPDNFVEEIVARAHRYFEPYGKDALAAIDAHVRYNLRSRYGKRMVFYYNRSSYQAANEFQTFQDEWDLTDFRSVGPGRSRGEVPIVPSESYIDHALYWYARSFDVAGNRGVYWDNWFFNPSYNTQMTGAYTRPDGSTAPSTGIWGLRELARRTFQMMNERGMMPITMAHMTSTGILPLLSFCTVQYDWEWKYGEGDFQYRFPRDYILLVSDGELAGTWPVLLGDHGKLESDSWTQRTFAGVCLVHEMTPSGWLPSAWDPLTKPVFALLDQNGLQVYRYWDERPQPVTTGDADLPGIVYSLPGREAVYVVTSYAEQPRDATAKIDAAALGLANGFRVQDAETGDAVPVTGGAFPITVTKHAVREFRIVRPTDGQH